jgi:acyl-CoA synthetase (AMP-forming)/AMP-acid ligase II
LRTTHPLGCDPVAERPHRDERGERPVTSAAGRSEGDSVARADIEFGTTPRLLAHAAATRGDAPAILDGDVVVTWAELEREARRAAAAYVAAGVAPGDRVAIWAPNVWEWIPAALGIHLAGGVLVPLNTRYKGVEAAYILGRSGARVLVTMAEFLGTDYRGMLHRAVDVGQELPRLNAVVTLRTDGPGGWDAFLATGDDVDPAVVDGRAQALGPDDLSDILFTSGTTGNPKGVMETHGATLRAYQAWSDVVGLRAGDRYLIVNPFFHAFGYKAGWLAAMLTGATIHPQAVFDVDAVLDRVARERITMLPGPPTLFHTILDHPRRGEYDLSSLRLAVTGAAAIPVELILRMRDELTFETIITGYGLTESCGIATMCRFDDDPETIATTSGRAIPDVEVLVVDDAGREVPRGEPGEVVVRGYNVMRGYLDDPTETAATIDDDGWLHTGDVGVMDERGYLRITDRTKDMFIVGGFNAYPAEIENLLLRNPAIAQAAVIGVPDARMGEVGMAFVVLRPDAHTTGDEIVAWSRDVMANFKVPRAVEIVDELPLNASGKVLKTELRNRAAGSDA